MGKGLGHPAKSEDGSRQADGPELAAIGLEAEFGLVLDGRATKVEEVFDDPRDFLGRGLIHRTGSSYHLPTGGAVYFDTGVIEIATPIIEIDRGCAMRAGRSLWESIVVVREGLGRWERRAGRRAALSGFSTHYNISFDGQQGEQQDRALDQLALLLSYILPCPVMVLATNRASTGVGVRPRGNRIEITADFTPSAPLLVATAALITGVVRAVMEWPGFGLDMLSTRRIPVIEGYSPMPHTSRRGWLARFDRYPQNPFTTGIDAPVWAVRHVRPGNEPATMSMRDVARRIFNQFRWRIARVADPLTFRLIGAVMTGRAPALLDLSERPAAYDDVGRLCTWDGTAGLPAIAPGAEAGARVARSRYERVLIRALSGAPLHIGRQVLTPLGTHGWSRIVFRRAQDGSRQTMTLDALLPYLDAWERDAS